MAVRDTFHRALVYFGLAEDDGYDDDPATAGRGRDPEPEPEAELEDRYRERPNVRRLQTRRRPRDDFDDIFADEGRAATRQTRVLRPVETNGRGDIQVHLVVPKSFNDAQQVADQFKDHIPVILNLQGTDVDLSKRLIDFASGMTYALDGGMQRIADKVFLLTPRNVEVSAEERARLIEKGFFNQSLAGPSRAAPHILCRRDASSASSEQATWRPRSRAGSASRCSSPTSIARRAEALAAATGGEALDVEPRGRRAGRRRRALPQARAARGGGAGDPAARAKAVVSILGGTPLAALELAYPDRPVYRFMPNIPAEVGKGVLLLRARHARRRRARRTRSSSCSAAPAR